LPRKLCYPERQVVASAGLPADAKTLLKGETMRMSNFPGNLPKRTGSAVPPSRHAVCSFLLLPAVLSALFFASCSNPAGSPAGIPVLNGGGGGGGSPSAITAFSLAGVNGTIRGTTIYVKGIPHTTDLTSAAPGIAVSPGAVVDPPSGAPQDFSGLIRIYTVTAADGGTTDYTVIAGLAPLTGISGIETCIDTAAGTYDGSTATVPIPLPVRLNLADSGGSGWQDLLARIHAKSKYVALDLSACTGVTGVFDPGTGTGKDRIVSLVLPDAATGIQAGSLTNLAGVAGAGITNVGEHAFRNCAALTVASFPAAAFIGKHAFQGCTALTTVSLPAAKTIDLNAFRESGAGSLTVILGGTAPRVASNMFSGITSKTVTVKTPAGAAGYGPMPFDNAGTAAVNWGNGFRGCGWTGSGFTGGGTLNDNITLILTN
jgi:hypothetical protein